MSQQDDRKKCRLGYHWDAAQDRCVLDVPEIIEIYWPWLEEEEAPPLEPEDFWLTTQGLFARLDMLAEGVAWKSFNDATVAGLKALGVSHVEWVADLDERTCGYCIDQNGHRYVLGMFLPELPAHPNCRCYWDYAEEGE